MLEGGADPYIERPWLLAKQFGYDDIANLLPIAFDQDFLLDVLKSLNYKINNKGVCFGFAHIVKHYIQNRQTHFLNNLLITLINLYIEVRKKVRIRHSNKSKKFQKEFLQEILIDITKFKNSKHPDAKQVYYDWIALLDGIYLYQYHNIIYHHWKLPFSTNAVQDTLNILENDKHKMEYRGQFSGVYRLDEIKNFLQLLAAYIELADFSNPVSFVLNSQRHAQTISYDSLTHSWTYADAANMPLLVMTDINWLAKKIFSSFTLENVTIFTSVFYAAVPDRKKMTQLMSSLLKNPAWEKIHKPTLEKIQARAGMKHKYTVEMLASGPDLKEIQAVKLDYKNNFVKQVTLLPTTLNNKFALFMANKTYGKLPDQLNNQDIPIYQNLKVNPLQE